MFLACQFLSVHETDRKKKEKIGASQLNSFSSFETTEMRGVNNEKINRSQLYKNEKKSLFFFLDFYLFVWKTLKCRP